MSDITLNVTSNDLNDVVNKLDKNLNDLTAEGKSLASGFGMPSKNYIDLKFEAGTKYTAPANGYVCIVKETGVTTICYCGIINETRSYSINNNSYGAANVKIRSFLPVAKGDQYLPVNNTTGDVSVFRFIYAEGEI